jgi:MFS family permease
MSAPIVVIAVAGAAPLLFKSSTSIPLLIVVPLGMSWPTTAFVASSIIAASGTSLVSGKFGNRRAFSGGAVIYSAGAVLCASASSMGFVIAGRFVQGLGGGLLSALAYVLVRNSFPEGLWPRVFGLLAGVWSITVLIGPLIGGVFASYGHWRGAFFTVAGIGCLLGAGARFTLPADRRSEEAPRRTFPAGRVALICGAIAFCRRRALQPAWRSGRCSSRQLLWRSS